MTKHEFLFPKPGGKPGETTRLTSLVMDDIEFDAIIQHIVQGDPVVNVQARIPLKPEDIEAMRAEKRVPLVARGTKTEYLFKLYEVKTDFFCVIVRGQGERVFKNLIQESTN